VKVTDDGHDTEFLYDADGERLIRRDGPLNTLYLPGMEVTFHTRDLSNEATRFYTHADETVAVKENDGTLSWLVSDHQGTGTMAINAVTGEWVQRRFTPFGQERASTGEWGTDKGFVGGIIDESTGFTQLGARAYDAALGRFISVDPVMDLSDPQQMHGYSYANNNPTTYSDPTGLAPKKSAGKPRPKSGGKSKGTIRKARRVGGRSPARQVNRGGSGYRGTRYTPVRVTYKRAGNRSGGTGKSRYSAPAKDPRAVALQSSRSLKSLAQQVPGLPPGCMPQFVVECYMSPSLKELSGALNYGRGKIGEGFDLIHRHAIVGGSACFGVCAGIQYQDGILSPFVGGFGVGGGYYGGYGHLSSRETGAWAPAVCGSRGFGGCLSAQTVRRRGMNFVEGFSVTGQGGAGFQIGGNMTVANVDVASLVRLEISRSIDFPEW
jgi:RHS repeat-associated protein